MATFSHENIGGHLSHQSSRGLKVTRLTRLLSVFWDEAHGDSLMHASAAGMMNKIMAPYAACVLHCYFKSESR